MRLPVRGDKRRKTLILVAAYRDAGQKNPLPCEMMQRLGFSTEKVRHVLAALEAEGWLHHNRKKHRLVLHFGPDGQPVEFKDGATA
ncbi:MAG TPA: hypothetical protein VMT20_07235 [Terriglobia bacterium]|nr:hypothetical protein [Terriglobia bacterium]